jgi:hypothetical protein
MVMPMWTSDVEIQGRAAMLLNRYTEKARPGKLRHEELLEEATRRVYRDPDSQTLILPGWNVKKCLMDGARMGEVKHGKKSIVQYLQALVIIDGDASFGRVEYDGLHVCQGRIPPRTGPMVTLYRPKLDPGWALRFRMIVADSTIHPETMKQIITFAGLLAGLGAWRPEYGRFVLERFEVSGFDTTAAPAAKPAKAKRAAA